MVRPLSNDLRARVTKPVDDGQSCRPAALIEERPHVTLPEITAHLNQAPGVRAAAHPGDYWETTTFAGALRPQGMPQKDRRPNQG